ncbi:hypothetical protein UC8_41020 [Roseimaritima ulvae]|uniref:Uncharacterized protein n=1 Tax=Roseimaritima ulvae TaxID=980254 RepID=A0A5B9QVS7_9BACT|nr:hypothetical protein UC8_41020 [Roseimaritima ulvae]
MSVLKNEGTIVTEQYETLAFLLKPNKRLTNKSQAPLFLIRRHGTRAGAPTRTQRRVRMG